MTIADLEKRIANLQSQIEQSVANHHVLLGSKVAFESVLAELKAEQAAPTEALAEETASAE